MTGGIIIVGAGPAGAMLAYLLASRGVNVTLLERQHDFEREFRGEVLMPSGVEVFRQAGLSKQFDELPKHSLRRAAVFKGERKLLDLELGAALGKDAAFTAVSQPAMLEMLVAQAARHASFTFIRGAAVRGLTVEDSRITGVEILIRGRTQTLWGDLVIGADGRASTVRRKAGLEIIRRSQHFDIVWCRVPLMVNDDYDGARIYVGNRHFALAYPTYDGRLQVAWVIRKGAIGELRSRGIEHWIAEMASHVSSEFGEHLLAHIHDVTQPFLLDVICDLMPEWTRSGLLPHRPSKAADGHAERDRNGGRFSNRRTSHQGKCLSASAGPEKPDNQRLGRSQPSPGHHPAEHQKGRP
jgi:2-polyprenyl-6-methoxyphenol hydroxylase-like FAD-dependent oxidoreductase